MFDFCSASSDGIGSLCNILHRLQDFIIWFDQRINLNEGVIAFVALLAGLAIRGDSRFWRWARGALIAAAGIMFVFSAFEPSFRPMWGKPPYYVEVPSLFRYSRGIAESKIAWDEAENNSVQLSGNNFVSKTTPQGYMRARCLTACSNTDEIKAIADREDILPNDVWVEMFSKTHGTYPDACVVNWKDTTQNIDHYEVFLVTPAPDGSGARWGRLQARIKTPTNVLISADYDHMVQTLTASAHATIKKADLIECEHDENGRR